MFRAAAYSDSFLRLCSVSAMLVKGRQYLAAGVKKNSQARLHHSFHAVLSFADRIAADEDALARANVAVATAAEIIRPGAVAKYNRAQVFDTTPWSRGGQATATAAAATSTSAASSAAPTVYSSKAAEADRTIQHVRATIEAGDSSFPDPQPLQNAYADAQSCDEPPPHSDDLAALGKMPINSCSFDTLRHVRVSFTSTKRATKSEPALPMPSFETPAAVALRASALRWPRIRLPNHLMPSLAEVSPSFHFSASPCALCHAWKPTVTPAAASSGLSDRTSLAKLLKLFARAIFTEQRMQHVREDCAAYKAAAEAAAAAARVSPPRPPPPPEVTVSMVLPFIDGITRAQGYFSHALGSLFCQHLEVSALYGAQRCCGALDLLASAASALCSAHPPLLLSAMFVRRTAMWVRSSRWITPRMTASNCCSWCIRNITTPSSSSFARRSSTALAIAWSRCRNPRCARSSDCTSLRPIS